MTDMNDLGVCEKHNKPFIFSSSGPMCPMCRRQYAIELNNKKMEDVMSCLNQYVRGIMLFNKHDLVYRYNQRLIEKDFPPLVVDSMIKRMGKNEFEYYVKLKTKKEDWRKIEMKNNG
jgi:hypothetical protein